MTQEASRVVLATLNANMHLVKMSFARGRKMKASAELRAMVEVDPAWSSRFGGVSFSMPKCRG
jgi:hypothetical protein